MVKKRFSLTSQPKSLRSTDPSPAGRLAAFYKLGELANVLDRPALTEGQVPIAAVFGKEWAKYRSCFAEDGRISVSAWRKARQFARLFNKVEARKLGQLGFTMPHLIYLLTIPVLNHRGGRSTRLVSRRKGLIVLAAKERWSPKVLYAAIKSAFPTNRRQSVRAGHPVRGGLEGEIQSLKTSLARIVDAVDSIEKTSKQRERVQARRSAEFGRVDQTLLRHSRELLLLNEPRFHRQLKVLKQDIVRLSLKLPGLKKIKIKAGLRTRSQA